MDHPNPFEPDPDIALTAWRYLQFRLDPQPGGFTVPEAADVAIVGGEIVSVTPAKISSFVEALAGAAIMTLFRCAGLEGHTTMEECFDYVRAVIDASVEAHTIDACERDGEPEP
jgi:hypothetical protein